LTPIPIPTPTLISIPTAMPTPTAIPQPVGPRFPWELPQAPDRLLLGGNAIELVGTASTEYRSVVEDDGRQVIELRVTPDRQSAINLGATDWNNVAFRLRLKTVEGRGPVIGVRSSMRDQFYTLGTDVASRSI
jgi:hypothetical protein